MAFHGKPIPDAQHFGLAARSPPAILIGTAARVMFKGEARHTNVS